MRGRRTLRSATRRAERVSARSRDWVERQSPSSLRGVAIGGWQRYRAIDGPLQSLLLTVYIVIAVLPALLVMDEYLERHPAALANHLAGHYGFSSTTAALLRSVLVQDRTHELGSALLAIAGALFFGLGFGRVLQLVHARAWRITLATKQTDYARYAAVLLVLYGFVLLLLVQAKELPGLPSWAGLAIAPGWIALLVLYFVWAPRTLTHGTVSSRDLVPGAVLTAVGLVVLMLISSFVIELWVNFYARDYGGLGVVMAIFFWIGFSSSIIVFAASLSPALAERRKLRRTSA